MDSNGRHRNPSGSSLTLPSSSTFRRLPSLARSPFRRSEKTSTPPIVDVTPPTTSPATIYEDIPNHHRGSTFPSLHQVVVDDSSVSSAFFASTRNSESIDRPIPEDHHSDPSLLPPSRSSSLLRTPETDHQTTSQPSLSSPFSNSKPSSNIGLGLGASPMISTRTATPPNISANESDLEPITYPAHLAQMRPDAQTHSQSQSPSSHANAASSSSRTIPRTRDFTPSPSTTSSTPGPGPQPPELGPVHRSPHSNTPGSGGPPFGVPKRKESIQSTSLEDVTNTTYSNTNVNPIDRVKEGETDSGPEESTSTRKRANTKPSTSAKSRDRSLTVPAPQSAGAGDGSSTIREKDKEKERDRDKDKSRRVSSKTSRQPVTPYRISEPLLPNSKNVPRASASAMYYSPVPFHGRPPNQALRAHSGTLVGERIWIIGGVDRSNCWRGVAWFDTESLLWSTIDTRGEQFPPLRAHTTTLVGDKLFIFGGGDGPTYSNEVWILDTVTHRFSRPPIGTTSSKSSIPPPRRAHTTVLYRNYLVIFGGGNGQAALNDVWALDISDLSNLHWQEWKTKGDVPQKKGYHTANLVGDKMIVFGGSDGHASFADIHVLNLQTRIWTLISTDVKHNRLSHTSTQVGSYLFIIGGHNGQTYAQDVLLFNLVTLQWESKSPRGVIPPGRGYHVALLHDARIYISGGYNGESVFDDLWTLDLSAGAYLPQVTTFEVDESAEQARRMLESSNI
ncbi:uncharacterized protein I303_100255 [Kwoniella dejecticola CBS 10117]|uniref:Kelch repeat-containing protein n=1 Tax=Kwoniella dejecticola CBS 10117 TaxID=1296121 RepID=A0A1A6AEF0_9TREE|nr:kelch repeat-containing protein [Kwoniella dejecticola CBS 10117]OBR88440.1 kelch repeat-containing protein [Kwoniella dejecticola CBS 10117]